MYGNLNANFLQILSTILLSVLVSLFPASVRAIALNRSLGTWNNAIGSENTINFQTVGNENQVRWGIPAGNEKSGLGFAGIGKTDLKIGDPFILGTLRHFNHPIFLPATAVELTLELEFSDPPLSHSFTIALEIEETPNIEPCAHPGTSICPDIIRFTPESMLTSLPLNSTNYALDILGFRTTLEGRAIAQIVSEELSTHPTPIYLVGSLHPTPNSQSVPEPPIGLGFFLLGLSLVKRR